MNTILESVRAENHRCMPVCKHAWDKLNAGRTGGGRAVLLRSDGRSVVRNLPEPEPGVR